MCRVWLEKSFIPAISTNQSTKMYLKYQIKKIHIIIFHTKKKKQSLECRFCNFINFWHFENNLPYLIEVVSSWDVLKHSWVFEGVVDCTSSWTNMAACDWLIPPYIPLAYILHSESLLSKLFILAISRNCRILWRFRALSVTCKKKKPLN